MAVLRISRGALHWRILRREIAKFQPTRYRPSH
uniref:Uncharacterized protein n=1 Tax=Arundo donax TaxID=35708 RepID=A0A0A9B980_ARUDO